MSKDYQPTDKDIQRAFPDMNLKNHIYDSMNELKEAHKKLMLNKMRNGGRVNPMDEYAFKVAILGVFYFIGEMARQNGFVYVNDQPDSRRKFVKSDYEYMQDLINFKDLDIDILVRLSVYNLNCLHRCNISNLLIAPEDIEAINIKNY